MSLLEGPILLVEDSEDDVFFMKRALQLASIKNQLHVLSDGQQALDYLAGEGVYCDRVNYPLPSVVFLDLKLPYKHGFEVLSWMRANRLLVKLRVVILTSSPLDRDHFEAEQLGAAIYLTKPPSREMLTRLWEQISTLTD